MVFSHPPPHTPHPTPLCGQQRLKEERNRHGGEKGVCCFWAGAFLCLEYLCVTPPGGGSWVEGIGLRGLWHSISPTPAESYWGLSVASKRQLGKGRQQWSIPFPSPLDMKRTKGTESPQTAGPMTDWSAKWKRGRLNLWWCVGPTALHHGKPASAPQTFCFILSGQQY